MTYILRDPDRDIGARLYGKFHQLTRMMDIDTRVVCSVHNVDGAARVAGNGIYGTEGGEIIPSNDTCHQDSTRREKGWIIIACQLLVDDLRQIRIRRVDERSCQTRFLPKSDQGRTRAQ